MLRYIPEYRCAKLTWDGARGVVDAFVARLSPTYSLAPAPEDTDRPETDAAVSPWVIEHREEYALGNFDPLAFLATLPRLPEGQYVAGADLGGSDDPTEILVFRVVADELTCVLRIQLRRWEYPTQARVMHQLHALAVRPSYGWGLDATGVGGAVEQQFRGLLDDPFAVSGYVWNATRPDVHPETGEPIVDDQGRSRSVTHKEAATQLLELDVQGCTLSLPFDPDILREWASHTSRPLPSGRRGFKRTDDHTIDAARAARLRLHDVQLGNLSQPPIQFAVPPGARRDSFGIQEAY